MEQDPDFVSLSRQFKTTAMELVSVLEQVTLVKLEYLSVFCSSQVSLLLQD